MGTPDFSVPILEQLIRENYHICLVVTQPDRPKGRKRELTPPPVKEAAVKHNIPVFQPESIKEDYEEILSHEPDLIVTAAYGQLLPNELLEAPPYRCINVHASLLPELRGGAPIHYAILQGKEETGITIMYMVEKLDAGDILAKQSIPINDSDDVGILHDKLADLGASLLIDTLPKLFNHELKPRKQDELKVTYAPTISRELERIDWTEDSRQIFNHIRGLRPWPVAYTTYEGTRMKIWNSEETGKTYQGKPGEIVKIIPEDSFIVLCGDNLGIKITEIQPAGSRKMKTADFLRGATNELSEGIILGE